MEFHVFSEKVNNQFNDMSNQDMYTVDIDRSSSGDAYLAAFPAGTNNLFIERTEHDCQTCRQFLKFIGTAVTINPDGSYNTVWDVEGLESPYLEVAKTLADLVRSAPIKSIFLHNEPKAGRQTTVQLLEDGTTRNWSHFWADIPNRFYERDLAAKKGMSESRAGVHERSLKEISLTTLEIVLDLLTSDSIYRGAEHIQKVTDFITMKKAFMSAEHQNAYAWLTYKKPGAGIRNTVIGSLLIDIEEGKDLEQSVKSFEAKVAPANYKRPKAVVTKRMLEEAIKVIDEKGIRSALPRRQAVAADVSVNDVIFADRSVGMKDQDPLLDLLDPQEPTEIKGLDNAPEISMEDFLANIVPTSTNISIVTSRAMAANKIQISAPADPTAKNILQWDNNFSWSYSGNVADSDIARNVKEAGGAIDGFLRCSLQWNEDGKDGGNDLDLHCDSHEGHIHFGNKLVGKGTLDIDITDPLRQRPNGPAVENITWPLASDLSDGTYRFYVHNYSGRNSKGFRIEIVIGSDTYNYDYSHSIASEVTVAYVRVKNGEFTIEHKLPHTKSNSGELVPVKMIMLSPNFWGNNKSGNKHYIFLTDEEQDTMPFRGYYNEFLSPELHDIRKPLDMLASKMMCEPTQEGLHGYGFSSTKRTSVYMKADNKLFKVLV